MQTKTRGFAAAALLAASAFAAEHPRARIDHIYRLDQSANALRRSADSLRAKGFRPLSIDGEGAPDSARITTVWTRSPGPAWALIRPTPLKDFRDSLSVWTLKGYRAASLAAFEPDPSGPGIAFAPAFAAIVIKDGRKTRSVLDTDPAGFQAACDSARQAGAECEWIEAYGEAAHPRMAAVFTTDTAGTPWNYSLGDDAAALRTKLDIFARVWVRPALIAPLPGGRFATIWEENSTGRWAFQPDLDEAGMRVELNREDRLGLRLTSLRMIPGAGRFSVLLSEHDAPLPRAWTVSGPAAPGLEGFDAFMRDLMQKRGVRAGALAIAREGRLAFAHGYTWGETDYPITKPNSLFRAASCSKPLTSILVHRMLREGGGREDAPSLQEKVLNLLHPSRDAASEADAAAVPADARFRDITVDQLLTHSGGWARSRNHPDPVFNDYPPGSEIRKRLPSSRGGFLSYMLRQPLQFAPGTRSVYDNFGYFLLGRLIESLPMGIGKSYQRVADDLLFKPLGLSRPRFAGSRYEERAPGEVLYHTAVPYLQANPVPGGMPWVPGAYGDFEIDNMDAAGAWLLSAPDYAKVLAAFDLGDGNPILDARGTATMWSPAGFGEALRGWFAMKVPVAPSGHAPADSGLAKWHNGLFPGTSTLVFYHPEKWSFVLFLDRDLSPQPDGPHEGRELARLAARVREWPAADLFPAMGIPPFPRPAIGPASGEAADK